MWLQMRDPVDTKITDYEDLIIIHVAVLNIIQLVTSWLYSVNVNYAAERIQVFIAAHTWETFI